MLNTINPALADLETWAQAGWLRPLDAAFARFLAHEVPQAPPTLLLAAALASHQLGRGHTCLDLDALVESPSATLGLTGPLEALRPLTLAHWLQATDCPAIVGHGDGPQPLVLEQHRLYLRRHWTYEQAVRGHLRQRMATALPPMPELRGWLDTLFPPQTDASPRPDWQKVACAVAAAQRFCLITGGPGTGKTTTVVRLLALLQAQALTGASGQALRIRLAAPTGKAAARLSGSIASAIDRLPLQHLPHGENLRAALPTDVQTLHRLLGARPDSRRLRHHAGNPLPLDVLVVDEASMIDLEMMHAVLDALPATARVVLLGDKDQLASVEAGAVLGQLCRDADAGHYHPITAQWVHTHTGEALPTEMLDPDGPPLAQHVVMLRHSRRFGADSGIGLLARQVNQGLVRQLDDMSFLCQALLDFGDVAQLQILAFIQQQGNPERRPDKIFRQNDPGSASVALRLQEAFVLEPPERGAHRVGTHPERACHALDARHAVSQFASRYGTTQMRDQLINCRKWSKWLHGCDFHYWRYGDGVDDEVTQTDDAGPIEPFSTNFAWVKL